MENQPNQPLPASRQWFRLASLARREALGQGPSQGPATATPWPAAPASSPGPAAAPALSSGPTQAAAPRVPLARLGSIALQPQPPQQPTPQQIQQEPKAQDKPPLVAAESQQPPTPKVSKSPTAPSPRSRIPSQAPTPPPPQESLKVIKQSLPTPPASPPFRKLKPIKAPTPYPEPEPKPQTAPSPTSKFTQQENSNGSVKAIAGVNGKQPANGNQSHTDTRALPPSLDKREATNNGVGMTTAWKKKDDCGEMKVISMAGENLGAYMELGSSQHVNRKQLHGYSLQNQTKGNEPHKEEVKSEDNKKYKGKSSKAEGKPMVALVNSNVQSVNNSILFRSSCTEKSPGVHMTIVRGQRQPKLKSTHHQ